MQPPALRRAFRARLGSPDCERFARFLERLAEAEVAWRALVRLIEEDVVPVVRRCHPEVDPDEITSACLSRGFEAWIPDWLRGVRIADQVRAALGEGRREEGWTLLEGHPRFTGRRAAEARRLFGEGRDAAALRRVAGVRSARTEFITRARAEIHEAQRRLHRQSGLLHRHCRDASGLPFQGGRASDDARRLCGAEHEGRPGETVTWRLSALPPAHLPSQELADRLRRMLRAIDELGPEHARVFQMLLEGLSQRRIAAVEGRHPAAISRRVRRLQQTCRDVLLG